MYFMKNLINTSHKSHVHYKFDNTKMNCVHFRVRPTTVDENRFGCSSPDWSMSGRCRRKCSRGSGQWGNRSFGLGETSRGGSSSAWQECV